MASLGKSFNPTEHDTEQRAEYGNLPNGDYVLEVSAADVKVSGEGSQRKMAINATMDVIEPEDFKGRKLFVNYNMENPSAEAQRIGQAQFASLCRALEITEEVNDTDDIMFKSFTVTVGMGKDSKTKNADGTPQYPARNEIKRYHFPDEGAVPPAKVSATQKPANDNRRPPANDNGARQTNNASSAPTPRAAGSKPWGKK